MTGRRKAAWVIAAGLIFVIAAAVGFMILLAGDRWATSERDAFESRKPALEQIVAKIRGEWAQPWSVDNNTITLPTALAGGIVGGQVFVYANGSTLIVAFPTWRGRGANFEGYVYITGTDFHSSPAYGGGVLTDVYMYQRNVTLERALDEDGHWWFGSFRGD